MRYKRSHGFFITGTDTGVGKTFVSALLTRFLGALYWKPIQTGEDRDQSWVQEHTRLGAEHFHPTTITLTHPLSPHLAAQKEGVEIDPAHILAARPYSKKPLIVEGAGGVCVPIAPDFMMLDLMKELDLPVIVVARTTLGTINHTLLTLEALRRHGCIIAGVILNGPQQEDPVNETLIQYGGVKILAEVPPLSTFPSATDVILARLEQSLALSLGIS